MKTKKTFLVFLISLLGTFLHSETLGDKIYKEVSLKGETFYKWLSYNALYEYDENGNEIHMKSIDRGLYEVWKQYDSKNNLIYTKTLMEYGTIEEWYDYNSKGQLLNIKTTNGIIKTYEYDSNDNLIHYYEKNGKDEKYEYNSKGQKIKKICSTGNEEYEYDTNGNLIHEIKHYSNSDKIYQDITYSYDESNRITYEFITPDYEFIYEYDANGNKIYYKSTFGEQWFEYDINGNMTYYKFNDIVENWYEYDYHSNGKIKTMKVLMKF